MFHRVWVPLTLLAILLHVARSSAAQSTARDILRQRTSPDGAADPALVAQTGWQTVRGFSYKVLLKAPDGTFAPVDPGRTFTTGQSFRLEIETHNDLWIYILNRGPTGTETLLFPEKDEEQLRVERGKRVPIPPVGGFTFTDPPGIERFRIVAAPEKLPWANPRELSRWENDQPLAPGQAQAAKDQQETRAKSLDQIDRKQSRLEVLDKPLGKVLETLTTDPASRVKAKETLLRPPPPEGANLAVTDVVRASPDAHNREPFLHEIRLEHRRP